MLPKDGVKMENSDKTDLKILTYLRVIAASSMRTTAERIINSSKKANVYKNLTGENSHQQISEKTGVPRRTVSMYIEEFIKTGLVIRASELSKYDKALFNLEELQIDINALERSEKNSKKVEPLS